MEAVFSILSMKNKALLPNINFQKTIPETGLIPQPEFQKVENIKTVLSNSFGFGGNNTCLVFIQETG